MLLYNVRDAFQLLKERGIARDKQEVRKWLNEGLIQANPPENRRIGWKIQAEALQAFIAKYENGEFEALLQRRKNVLPPLVTFGEPSSAASSGERQGTEPASFVRLEEEVVSLRQQVRVLRRELNDLKKVLGFPVLASTGARDGADSDS